MTHPRIASGPVLAVLLAVAGAAAVGCASNKDAADKQFDDLRSQLTKVQADAERFGDRLGALEAAENRRQVEEQQRAATGTPRDPARPEDRPKLRVVHVRPDGAIEEDAPAAESASDATRPVIRASGRTGSAEGTEHPDAKRDFEAAMSLVKGKKYDKAIEAFDGFLGRFSDSPRAENAMYWRGECLFAKSDWARAAEQFEAVLARYPQGQKSPDALLKLGLSYARSSDKDKAHDAFAKLKSQYPKSDAAKQAPRD